MVIDGVTLGGQEIPVDQVAQQLAGALAPLGMIVDLEVDEQLRSASSLTVRALHLKVLTAAGTPVLEVIAGEARTPSPGRSAIRPARGRAAATRPAPVSRAARAGSPMACAAGPARG